MEPKEKYGLDAHLARFGTDQMCYDYLVQVKWKGKPQCPSCYNEHMNYFLVKRKVYKCSKCYKQFSLIQGTIFEKSKVPLSKWFLCIYLFTTKKRGISSVQMAKWLGVKQHTAWFMMHRLREALKNENNIILSGVVEADETSIAPKVNRDLRLKLAKMEHDRKQEMIFGISKNKKRRQRGFADKRGRKKGSTKDVLKQKKIDNQNKGVRIPFERGIHIFGIIERNGRVVMRPFGISRKSVTQRKIFDYLKSHVNSDSILITDESSLYKDAKDIFIEHQSVNHEMTYVINGVHINNIENAWKQLKTMILGTYGHISFNHIERYLSENTFRYNRRNESEKVTFENLIPLVIGKRIIYKELINEHKTAA